jgi:MoaA/NifB/PqqE/SkfB family radical SAM enzyme
MENKFSKDYLLFRFVPTMGCNYRCSYCFVPEGQKNVRDTLFDVYSPSDWVQGMAKWGDYDVEFYMWGGEPFSLAGTFELVKGWTEYDHIVSCNRIDTNTYFVEKILERCPTSKVKLNCSWHREYETLQNFFKKVVQLNEQEMVGMVNFVASESNIKFLLSNYNMNIDELVAMFDEIGVFVNVASDIIVFEGKNFLKKHKFKKILSKYTCPEDWNYQRETMSLSYCEASKHFFTVDNNGNIRACLSNEVVGNFFEGSLYIKDRIMCKKPCHSMVAYPFRMDNSFPYRSNLLAYVARNRAYRHALVK